MVSEASSDVCALPAIATRQSLPSVLGLNSEVETLAHARLVLDNCLHVK